MVLSRSRKLAYDARCQPSLVDPTLAAVAARQRANFARYVADFYPHQIALRDQLNTLGVSGNLAFQFEAFSNQCYAASRRFAGPALLAAVNVLIAKYAALGLSEPNLVLVALRVWNVLSFPAKPLLDLPGADQEDVPTDGNLSWYAAARTMDYDVYLYVDGEPPELLVEGTDELFAVYDGLDNSEQYEWYVVGRNENGFGPPSIVRGFRTVDP